MKRNRETSGKQICTKFVGRQFLLTENQDLGAEVQYSSANNRWKGFQLKGSGIIVGSCGFGTSLIQRYSTCENYS